MEDRREILLSAEEISIRFLQYDRGLRRRWLEPIRDLSLEAAAGEVTAVAGASGSGKSLLAHGIMGILPYNAYMDGKVEYLGKELTPERLKRLRGREIALIPQGVSGLDPLMKAGKQIRAGRRDPEAFRRCRELLARYGLPPETEDMYPFELSGGMARRVLIAGAMMENPRLVIADEPTPGLDMETARQVMGHFREMADQGAGVLLITHDLELALETADRVLIFNGGQVVETLEMDRAGFRPEQEGFEPKQEGLKPWKEGIEPGQNVRFKTPPVCPYTRRLLASIPGTGKRWEEIAKDAAEQGMTEGKEE